MKKIFLIAFTTLLLSSALTVPITKSSCEFSMFNTGWNGCSEFAKILHESGGVIPVMYPYNTVGGFDGTLVVVGPDVGFSSHEADAVKKFVENGGTLFIADDFGSANSLLTKMGVDATFYNKPLKDIFYTKSMDFPVVVKFSSELRGFDRVVLDVPSAITTGGEGFSSSMSVIGEVEDIVNKSGNYVVFAEIKYGSGRIILFSDPSALMNDLYPENKEFMIALASYLGNKFYFDEVHHSDFNPYSMSTTYVYKELDMRSAGLVLFVLVVVGFVSLLGNVKFRISRRTRQRELPAWVDDELFGRMIREMRSGSKYGDENEHENSGKDKE